MSARYGRKQDSIENRISLRLRCIKLCPILQNIRERFKEKNTRKLRGKYDLLHSIFRGTPRFKAILRTHDVSV